MTLSTGCISTSPNEVKEEFIANITDYSLNYLPTRTEFVHPDYLPYITFSYKYNNKYGIDKALATSITIKKGNENYLVFKNNKVYKAVLTENTFKNILQKIKDTNY